VTSGEVLRKKFSAKREELTWQCKKSHIEIFNHLLSSPIFSVDPFKEEVLGWAFGVCVGQKRCLKGFDGET
jgi:hypothetical protein